MLRVVGHGGITSGVIWSGSLTRRQAGQKSARREYLAAVCKWYFETRWQLGSTWTSREVGGLPSPEIECEGGKIFQSWLRFFSALNCSRWFG